MTNTTTYNYPNLKNNRRKSILRSGNLSPSLQELIKNSETLDTNRIISAYCSELLSIISSDNLENILERIEIIEEQLDLLENEVSKYDKTPLPSVHRLHRDLAPLMMKVLLSSRKENASAAALDKSMIEVIRIVLEEDLYTWKEKLLEKNALEPLKKAKKALSFRKK